MGVSGEGWLWLMVAAGPGALALALVLLRRQGQVERDAQLDEMRGLSRELVDAGLLRQMNLGGRAVYEHDYGYPRHDHLHCQKCNRLIEFRSEAFERLRDAVAQEHNFRVTGHRLIIAGICEECSRRGRRP